MNNKGIVKVIVL